MATYSELYALHSGNDDLIHKIAVANWIAADTIRAEAVATPNHTNRLLWAAEVLRGGGGTIQQMLNAVLAQNRVLSVSQITSASDSSIQTAVNAAVDLVAGTV